MNRRNVLGNRIEESKTLWVVLTGILVACLQFIIYHFVASEVAGVILAALCMLLGTAVVHFITKEQEEFLGFLLIPCAFSGIFGILAQHMDIVIFPSSTVALWSALFSYLIPMVYALVYTCVMGNTEASAFSKVYIKGNVIFYAVYFGLMIYAVVTKISMKGTAAGLQPIPFSTVADLVDGWLKHTVPGEAVAGFFVSRIVFFLPYGFFVGMVARKLHGAVRILMIVSLPFVGELLEYIMKQGTADADDVIFRILGTFLGVIVFYILDAVFQYFTGRHMDGSEIDRDYYGRKI